MTPPDVDRCAAVHIGRLVTLGNSLPKTEQWDYYRLALAEAIRALRQGGGWTRTKPTEQGIYRVRGWNIGSEADVAVVSVIEYDDALVCNLHERNSDTEYEEWDDLARFSDRFEWQRVADLCAAPPSPAKEG